MERALIPQPSHYYPSEMEDRPLSPRLHHLLIREQRPNELTRISPRPISTGGCGSRASSGYNSASLNTPLSPLSANNPDLTISPHSQSQHGSIRRSVSPASMSFHLSSEEIPTPNRRTNSILSLLNGPMSSSPISCIGPSNSFPYKAELDNNRYQANSPYPRPPPATFPITEHSQATYFEERPYLPPTPGSIETYNPGPSSFPEFHPYHAPTAPYMPHATDRPGIYRRHSSHPNKHHSLYPNPVHPPLHRHSTPHSSSATLSTRFDVSLSFPPPPPPTAYASGPYESDFRVSGPRVPISRTTKACNSCRNRKVRCDAGATNGGRAGEAPCTRCKEGNLECVYTNVQKKRGPCPGLVPLLVIPVAISR